MLDLSFFADLLQNSRRSGFDSRLRYRAGGARESWFGSLRLTSAGGAVLLLLALPACQVDARSGEGGAGGSTPASGSTGVGRTCTPDATSPSRSLVTDCGACAAGCFAVTPQIDVCPDRAAPIATDCSPDVAKADNACACEGRTCGAGQQCYKALVAWDGAEVHNVCGPDPQCLVNTDCAAGQVCVPPFRESALDQSSVFLDDPGGVCVTPECQTDADCTAAPCGVCSLLLAQVSTNSGRDKLDGIKCVYGKPSK